jgi:aspartyl-tRNA(Asn)/glutamyl-tRNA(Gln) amidotransferase subunit A
MLETRAGATASRPLHGLRIGLPREFFPVALDGDVNAALRAALAGLESLGATLVDVSLPRTELSIPVYYIIAPAEASSNLSRFDGVKFGHRAAQYADLTDMYEKTRSEGFGAEVKRRIMIGPMSFAWLLRRLPPARKAAHDRDDFRVASASDPIAGPVAPEVARRPGRRATIRQDYLADIFTLPASLAIARHERAGRYRRAPHAGWAAADRQLLRRSAPVARLGGAAAGY